LTESFDIFDSDRNFTDFLQTGLSCIRVNYGEDRDDDEISAKSEPQEAVPQPERPERMIDRPYRAYKSGFRNRLMLELELRAPGQSADDLYGIATDTMFWGMFEYDYNITYKDISSLAKTLHPDQEAFFSMSATVLKTLKIEDRKILYSATGTSVPRIPEDSRMLDYRMNFVYDDLSIIQITEYIDYDVWSALADIGGYSGLFLGTKATTFLAWLIQGMGIAE
jgi:hypothetical protein